MNRINPFDNLYFKQGLGETEGINSPSKIDEKKSPQKPDEGQGIDSLPKSNEDDFVDMSNMVDDTENFDTSNFNFNEDDTTSEINNTEQSHNEEQGQNNQNQDDIKEEASQFINDLLEKQN